MSKPKTTTQGIDPAIKPYRDYFVQNAFSQAANRPLSFYGVPGSTGTGLPGTPGYGGYGGGVPGYDGRPRPRDGRSGPTPNFGFGGDTQALDFGGPQVNPGVLGPNGGGGGGGGGGEYGIGGAPGQAVGGPDPWVAGASDYTRRALDTPFDQQRSDFFNPFESQVVDAVKGDFANARTDALANVDDVATKSRAFGGSRHGAMAGRALGDIARAETSALSGLRYGGFNDATQNAMANRQFMMGAGDYMRNIGQSSIDAARNRYDTAQNLPFQRLGFMQSALGGAPQGQTYTQPGGDLWSQLLGAGISFAGSRWGGK